MAKKAKKRSKSSKKRSKKSISRKAKKKVGRSIKKRGAKKSLKKTKKAVKAKRAAKARPAKKMARAAKAMPDLVKKKTGEIIHFYTHISVAVVKLENELRKGDNILIEGATTHIKQKAESMQIDRKDIDIAKKDQEIGLLIKDRAREGDIVYKV
ncbi:MAG: hypothetical protein NT001_06500 [Candidatus Woesearchaeota archaeon]|nr:hypothetical protein [Candidatus Woesearchaeota archaeon]